MKEIFPKHIALIPDGNRRWAKRRKLSPWLGHQEGLKALEKILEKALELKVPYFTFWGSSWDNLTKRPKREVNFLIKVYNQGLKKILKEKRVHQHKVKVRIIGRWSKILPSNTKKLIKEVTKLTKNYQKHHLTFLLAYDGRDEMIDCIKNIIKKRIPPQKITPQIIKEHLWTKDLPPVDLIIRTGCENDPHNSAGFMMWETAYSQWYFTKTLFPDFSPQEFIKALKSYSQRERRLGA